MSVPKKRAVEAPADSAGDEALTALLRSAFTAAVAAADPARVLARHLPRPPQGRLVVLAVGKASLHMAEVAGERYAAHDDFIGLAVVPHGSGGNPSRFRVVEAGHPVPDQSSLQAAELALAHASGLGERDMLLVLISGGGSALLSAPEGVSAHEKAELTQALLRSGAEIGEINCVRRHLSRVKGGRLAAAAAPAQVVGLILSDVVGDRFEEIASGPTAPDPTTFQDALAVLDRYGVDSPPARRALETGAAGRRDETLKPGDSRLRHVSNLLVGSNQQSLEAAAGVFEDAGYAAHVLSNSVTGEAREAGRVHAAIVRQILAHEQPFSPPCAIISGGETTVTVRGGGRGGRNSEFALALSLALTGGVPAAGQAAARVTAPVAALIADSDGRDGSESNAGVFVLPGLLGSLDRRNALQLQEANDSYALFADRDLLFNTGPTGTNVNDLRFILVGTPLPGSRPRP